MTSQPSLAVRMITMDCRDPARLAAFWSAATQCPLVADYGDFVMVGSTPMLGFQRVDEPTAGKNRVHVDWAASDRAGLIARLGDLGATEHETRSVPGLTWTVMADPEGNLFCIGDADAADS